MFGRCGHGDTADCLYPTKLEFLQHDPIRAVACGSNHTVAASHRGFAYAWGWGEQGRLGLGDEEGRLTPELIETLAVPWRQLGERLKEQVEAQRSST